LTGYAVATDLAMPRTPEFPPHFGRVFMAMAATYFEILAEMQEQGLESLKTVQSAYLQSLTTAREIVEKLPTAPKLPVIEGMPTLAELAELNTKFVEKLVAQQKAYAKQLVDVFTPAAS